MEPKLKRGDQVEVRWLLTGDFIDVAIIRALSIPGHYYGRAAIGPIVLCWSHSNQEWVGSQAKEDL